jgi:hypothetical protein
MQGDEETFYQRKLSSKKGVNKNSNNDKCKSEKSSLPSLEFVGFNI